MVFILVKLGAFMEEVILHSELPCFMTQFCFVGVDLDSSIDIFCFKL